MELKPCAASTQVSAIPDQFGNNLHVVRHREQVQAPQLSQHIPMLGEVGDIAGQRRRIARYIRDSPRLHRRDPRHHCRLRTCTRRIEHHQIDLVWGRTAQPTIDAVAYDLRRLAQVALCVRRCRLV